MKDRLSKTKKKVIFHQDNTHSNISAMAKIHELKYELLLHLPYSPDLAPSDFHPFPKLKMFLGGQGFSTTEELTGKVEWHFAGLEVFHFRDGIKALEYCWTKCTSLQGDYVENENSSTEIRHFFLVHSENFPNHPQSFIGHISFKVWYLSSCIHEITSPNILSTGFYLEVSRKQILN